MKDEKLVEMISSSDYEMNLLACSILIERPYSEVEYFFKEWGDLSIYGREIYSISIPARKTIPYVNNIFLCRDYFLNVMSASVVLSSTNERDIDGMRFWLTNDGFANRYWEYDKGKNDK